MLVRWAELPKSPGHAFSERLQTVLAEAGFEAVVATPCKPYGAAVPGAPSLPPGRCWRRPASAPARASPARVGWSGAAPTAWAAGFPRPRSAGTGGGPYLAAPE